MAIFKVVCQRGNTIWLLDSPSQSNQNEFMISPVYDDIHAAARRLDGVVIRTPLLRSAVLSERLGAQIYLKSENLQHTGSFKFRGAYNALSQIPESERQKGVFAISSGNHGQGVAEAARLLGLHATILMPHDAPEIKIARTRASGSDVVFYNRAHDDRESVMEDHLSRTGAVLIHPYNNAHVIAGQGTVGLEIAEQLHAEGLEPDYLLACTGGGGLAAGIALACCERYPALQMFSVEPDGFDDYRQSLATGTIVTNRQTTGSICDSILTPAPGIVGFTINRQRLAGGLSVSDGEALQAIRFLFENHRMLAEPGGAVALAAILCGKLTAQVGSLSGKTIVATVSGGNIGKSVLLRALDTGLEFAES